MTFHHLVTDGFTQELLLQELAACYSAARAGRSPALPPAMAYAHYVERQQAYLGGERFRADEAYWLQQFAGELPPALELPGHADRPEPPSYRAQRQQLTLSGELYARLQRLGREQG
jgi:hypothetical protein